MTIKTAALLKGTCNYHTDGKFFLFGQAYTKEWFQETVLIFHRLKQNGHSSTHKHYTFCNVT